MIYIMLYPNKNGIYMSLVNLFLFLCFFILLYIYIYILVFMYGSSEIVFQLFYERASSSSRLANGNFFLLGLTAQCLLG